MNQSEIYDSSALLFELTVRVLMDALPLEPLEGAYLYAQTEDNEQSVLAMAPILLENSTVERLLVADSPPRCGYPGIERWKPALLELGVSEEQLLLVPTAEYENLNTLTEASAVIELVKQEGIESLLVTAHPVHQMRAFMTMATVAMREAPGLRLYSLPALPQPWGAEAVHSQGLVRAVRHQLLHSEWERLERYRLKGDLASVPEVLGYLNRRDSEG